MKKQNTILYNKLVQRWLIRGRDVEEHKCFTATDMKYIHKTNGKLYWYKPRSTNLYE